MNFTQMVTLFASKMAGGSDGVCSIPFSQPTFFVVALFIWTLTCFAEVKTCVELFMSLIMRTAKVDCMSDALSPANDGNVQTVQGLTSTVKGIICSCIIAPRAGITILLLWLGG